MIIAILIFSSLLRLYEAFEDIPQRWKLVKGTLERDFQMLCLDLSKYSDLKQIFTTETLIKAEMFECLIENTKYLVSNESLWRKLDENKTELTRKYFIIYFLRV